MSVSGSKGQRLHCLIVQLELQSLRETLSLFAAIGTYARKRIKTSRIFIHDPQTAKIVCFWLNQSTPLELDAPFWVYGCPSTAIRAKIPSNVTINDKIYLFYQILAAISTVVFGSVAGLLRF